MKDGKQYIVTSSFDYAALTGKPEDLEISMILLTAEPQQVSIWKLLKPMGEPALDGSYIWTNKNRHDTPRSKRRRQRRRNLRHRYRQHEMDICPYRQAWPSTPQQLFVHEHLS